MNNLFPNTAQTPRQTIKTNRNIFVYALLWICTFSLSAFYQGYTMARDLNIIAGKHDGKKDILFNFYFCSFLTCRRINQELKRRNINYQINKIFTWLPSNLIVLCCFLLYLIDMYQIIKGLNLLAADYNQRG